MSHTVNTHDFLHIASNSRTATIERMSVTMPGKGPDMADSPSSDFLGASVMEAVH